MQLPVGATQPCNGQPQIILGGITIQNKYGNTDQALGWSQLAGVTLRQHAQCA